MAWLQNCRGCKSSFTPTERGRKMFSVEMFMLKGEGHLQEIVS